MELTKQNLLQSVETLGRIYMAFMAEYYGNRFVEIDVPAEMGGGKAVVSIDFEMLKKIPCGIDLDAGASAYWSEIANMQTLDNLLMQGKIPTSEYLRRLPNGQISDREKLIAIVEAAERGQVMSADPAAIPGVTEEGEALLRGGAGYGALQRKINETGEVPQEV
jgi:hypothetical protein